MPPAKSTQERRHVRLFTVLFLAAALSVTILSCSAGPQPNGTLTPTAVNDSTASQPTASPILPGPETTAETLSLMAADTPEASLAPSPTAASTPAPTAAHTVNPTPKPTPKPILKSTAKPAPRQTAAPTARPTAEPTEAQITALASEPAPEPTPVPDSGGNKSLETKMISMVNDERKAQGLAALSYSSGLRAGALKHSNDMSQTGDFSHDCGGSFQTRFNAAGYTTGAENIAMYGSIEDAHNALMNSEGHRTNILNSAYKHIGIGIVYNEDRKVYYITQWFSN